jgi:transposase
MFYVRTNKTPSGSTSVQVVSYLKRKRIIEAHIGSTKDELEILELKKSARSWIDLANKNQLSLFPKLNDGEDGNSVSSLISIDKCQYLGFRYQLLYDVLWSLSVKFKFHLISASKILNDLVIARIAFPSSKHEAFEFINDFFGIKHHRTTFYRQLESGNLKTWQDEACTRIIAVAKKNFGFNFSLVFYDLTTLYFESFETDELRKIGFSKDNKASNPQIMIGLLVNDLGFPISYQLFAGNKFEGHTLMPSILALRKKYKIKQMTVVADSAMISDKNVEFLKAENLNYIVAARTANLPIQTIEEISQKLHQQKIQSKQDEEPTIRLPTASKGDLILSFSSKRYAKEKREMEKQLAKAEFILKTPSAAEIIKRTKFLKGKKLGYELNQDLIHKTTLLLGIKGYYTNCSNLTNAEVIGHYKNLWHVEKSFRISKSDLKARPIFHNKQQAIETHILICFMALALAKYIEIKTKKSIRSTIKELKKITDARIFDKIHKREITMRSEISDEVKVILDNLVAPM